jgi:hypothetical protein
MAGNLICEVWMLFLLGLSIRTALINFPIAVQAGNCVSEKFWATLVNQSPACFLIKSCLANRHVLAFWDCAASFSARKARKANSMDAWSGSSELATSNPAWE